MLVKIMVPFWGTLNIRCRTRVGTQKRDHNFDNHPCIITILLSILITIVIFAIFTYTPQAMFEFESAPLRHPLGFDVKEIDDVADSYPEVDDTLRRATDDSSMS